MTCIIPSYALPLQDVAKAEVDDVVDALEILYIRCDYSGAGLTGKHRDTDIISNVSVVWDRVVPQRAGVGIPDR